LLEPRLRLGLAEKAVVWTTFADGRSGRLRALLHSLDVDLENVGAPTLWDPEVAVKVRALDSDQEVATVVEGEGIERRSSLGALSGVGPGETATLHYRFLVAVGTEAFRVSAEVTVAGHAWHRSITVANQIAPRDPATID
jgi:hypothetical protein